MLIVSGQTANGRRAAGHPGASASSRRWAMLAILFVAQMLAMGSISYGFGLFVVPVSQDYGLSRVATNGGLMLLIGGMALFSPILGYFLDRVDGRRILLVGAPLFALGCVVMAWSGSLPWMAIAALLLVAPGAAALGPVTGSTLVARSFPERRGQALGILAVSSSAGGFVVVPAIAAVIGAAGWHSALVAIGGAAIVLIAVPALLMGPLQPPPTPSDAGNAEPAAWTAIARARDFWLIALAVGLIMAVDQALLVSLVPYQIDRGVPLQSATVIVVVISATAIAGKIAIGYMADKIDNRWLLAGVALLNAAFLQLLQMSPAHSTLLIAAVFVGFGFGGSVPLWASLSAARFGASRLGLAMGMTSPVQTLLAIGALSFVGQSYDKHHDYLSVFNLMTYAALASGVAILPVRRRIRSMDQTAAGLDHGPNP